MPRVFVHGNPETADVWRYLVQGLQERGEHELVLLSPPGFGAPVPPGFPATMEAYRDWLVGELEALGGEVDLVGHDWGAAHVAGAAAARPDLVRSWAMDCGGLVHPEYRWHGWARAWQTPGVGELSVRGLAWAPVRARRTILRRLHMPAAIAAAVAPAQDMAMGACVLTLYRSAVQPAMAELGRRLVEAERRPGLVIIPTADPYPGPPAMSEEMARLTGAATVRLDGMGHWWMLEGAPAAADALVEHWAEA